MISAMAGSLSNSARGLVELVIELRWRDVVGRRDGDCPRRRGDRSRLGPEAQSVLLLATAPPTLASCLSSREGSARRSKSEGGLLQAGVELF